MMPTTSTAIPFSDEARDRALEAAYIQTGLRTQVDVLTRGLENRAKVFIDNRGFSKEVGTAVYLYKIYKAQSVSFPVGKGRRLTLTPSSCTISLPWDLR